MAILTWDNVGERRFETGVSKGVLYLARMVDRVVSYPEGVAWNGLTSVSCSPDGADADDFYADNIKYLSLRGVENFGGSISAYTYPDEWGLCDGSAYFPTGTGTSSLDQQAVILHQQKRQTFGLCFQTIMGNDINPEYGAKYHLIWGATASPSDKEYATVNDSPEPIEFNWDFDTTPVPVSGFESVLKPVAYMEIVRSKLTASQISKLETALYGGDNATAHLPMPGEIYTLLTTS